MIGYGQFSVFVEGIFYRNFGISLDIFATLLNNEDNKLADIA
jgi:hypothetical protein